MMNSTPALPLAKVKKMMIVLSKWNPDKLKILPRSVVPVI